MRKSKENVMTMLQELAKVEGYNLVSAKFKTLPYSPAQELRASHRAALRTLGIEGGTLTLDLDNYPIRGGSKKRHPTYVTKEILKSDPTCAYCGNKSSTVDHVVPRARGGSNNRKNLVGCCFPCNNLKGAFLPKELGWKLRLPQRAFDYELNGVKVD